MYPLIFQENMVLNKSGYIYCTGAYIINKNTANKIINKYFIIYEKDFSLWRRKGKFRRINL